MLICKLWFKFFNVSLGHFFLIRVKVFGFIIRKVKRMNKIILFFWVEILVFSFKIGNIMYFLVSPFLVACIYKNFNRVVQMIGNRIFIFSCVF